MPIAGLRFRSTLAVSFFLPWFPAVASAPPEDQPPEVAAEVGAAGESQPAAPGAEEPAVLPGVIIEEIPKGSALEKAGLQVGDVILSWQRLPNPPANPERAQGELTSYFDWFDLEVEQAPRGAVVLRGRRGREALEIRVASGIWDAKVRPVLSQVLEEAFLAGKAQLASGHTEAAIRVWRSLTDSSVSEGGGDLRAWGALRIGVTWGEKVEWGKAIEVFREILEATKTPSVQVATWEALGKAHERRNEYDDAENAYASALEIGQKLNSHSLSVSNNLNNLGNLAGARGALDQAQEYLLRALQIREQLAPQSLKVAGSLNNLGHLASTRGELDRAQEYYRQALKIKEQLAKQSLTMAISLNNLAAVAWARGELGNAHSYLLRALKIHEQLAPGSLEAAYCLNNLGNVARLRGELDRSLNYHLFALTIREKLAPQSLNVAATLTDLGILARLRGEFGNARDYHIRALHIFEQLAPQSLTVASSLNNLGNIAGDQGEPDRAGEYYLRALRIKQQLAPQSLNLASTLNNLGNVALLRGELEQAYAYSLQALQIHENLAPETFLVAANLKNLGDILGSRFLGSCLRVLHAISRDSGGPGFEGGRLIQRPSGVSSAER